MNILYLTVEVPYPPIAGSQLRDFHVLKELTAQHQVTLCCLLTNDGPADFGELKEACASIETYRLPRHPGWPQLSGAFKWPLACLPFYVPAMAAKIHSMLAGGSFEIVQIEHSFLACYRDSIPLQSKCRTVLSFHNIGALQYKSIANLNYSFMERLSYAAKAWLMQDWEARMAARFDHSVVVSPEDGRFLADADPSLPFSVIENGVDTAYLQPITEQAVQNELVFVGVLGYPPNSDGVMYFSREILPLIRDEVPDVHLTVIGRAAPSSMESLNGSANVTLAGFVEDLMPYYRNAKVAVVPLRAGGGTRLKILEAMALGRPVVSTSVGCQGIAAEPGRHLLVADTPVEFAHTVVRLLRDEGLRNEIAQNARRLVEQVYDWRILGRKLVSVYDRLLA
jgi:sugar transferase (PEP-CTERM/EpsH1 system associated)